MTNKELMTELDRMAAMISNLQNEDQYYMVNHVMRACYTAITNLDRLEKGDYVELKRGDAKRKLGEEIAASIEAARELERTQAIKANFLKA